MMEMQKGWFLGIVLVLSYLVAGAQAPVLTGKVLGEDKPLRSATVSLKGVQQHQLTDSAGTFSFHSLVPGRYTLQVSMVGYEPYIKNIAVSEENNEMVVHLQPTNSTLNEVVVSGTMKPVHKLQSPIAVEVYTPQFFSKNPTPSIFESLQQVNGVRPQINCNVCNTGDIHINGLEGPYTLVTIDGMPIVSSLASVYGLFGIPNQLIERVEIVKGPASGLYGSEAIGGVINIITKAPEKAPLLTTNVMTTSWLEHNADIGLRIRTGKSATALLGINYFNYQKPFDKDHDRFTDVTLQHRVSVFNKWSLQRRHNRQATLAARFFTEDRWGGDVRWNKTFRGGDSLYGESIYTNRWELIGKYQLPVAEKMFFTFSTTAHHQDSYYGITPYLADQKIAFGQLTWDKTYSAAHDLLIGLAGRYNYYDDNSTATVDTFSKKNRPEQNFIPGVFVQDEWAINEKHHLLAGLRYDYHTAHGAIFTPRLAHKWKINERQVLRLNAGTGFRVVNLFTEDHAALTGARAVEVQEELKPEKSYNASLNYVQQMGTRSKQFSLDATLWYTYFNNQIIADYDTDPNKIIYDNLHGHSVSKGISASLELNLWQRLRGTIGATVQDVVKKETNGFEKVVKERPVLTERWSGTWTLSYSLPLAGLVVDYTGTLYGPMRLPLASPLDPRRAYSPVWGIQNVQVTKRFNAAVEIFGGVKNLLNWTPAKSNPFLIARAHDPFDKAVQYDASGAVLATPENPYALTFDPSYVYAPNQGIRFFIGAKLKIKE